jgi:transcriptional regulator with XRE-family HTH domain
MRSYQASRTVGRRIATTRQRAGLTAQMLADRLGWPRETLVNVELGRRALTLERLQGIAAALDMHPAELLFDQPEPARLAVQIANDARLASHVRFFLDSFDHDDDA